MTAKPAFQAALERYKRLADKFGKDSPAAQVALARVMDHAPPELLERAREAAKGLGLLPDPAGYLENGEPVYELSAVAAKLGMTEAEARASLAEIVARRLTSGESIEGAFVDPTRVHRRQ